MLTDKRLIITGVVRPDSIAWAVAAHAQRAGAHVLLTAVPSSVTSPPPRPGSCPAPS